MKITAIAISAFFAGCIVATNDGPTVSLAGSDKQVTFKEVAHTTIQPGMSRDTVLETMRGYRVSTTQSSDLPSKRIDNFGTVAGDRNYLYIAAWEGRHSWGVYPVKGEFGLVVRYDQALRVEEAHGIDTS